jgi:hypothetical protein
LADKDLLEKTVVYFYIVKGVDDSLKTFFCQDDLRYYPPPAMRNSMLAQLRNYSDLHYLV